MSNNNTSKKPSNNSQHLSKSRALLAGSIAACIATTFTNPLEIAKTRMQTLSTKGTTQNPFKVLVKVYQREGIRSLQRGLSAAYIYQIGLNGVRLGSYENIRFSLENYRFGQDKKHVSSSVVAGVVAGGMGGVFGQPLFLTKTRLQNGSRLGVLKMIKQVMKERGGFLSLWRGSHMAIARSGTGSAVQLPVYYGSKNFLENFLDMKEGIKLHIIASTLAGCGVAVAMSPWDTLLTRMSVSNDHSFIVALKKLIAERGILGLYAGFTAQLARAAPHTVLCLVWLEQTTKWVSYL